MKTYVFTVPAESGNVEFVDVLAASPAEAVREIVRRRGSEREGRGARGIALGPQRDPELVRRQAHDPVAVASDRLQVRATGRREDALGLRRFNIVNVTP